MTDKRNRPPKATGHEIPLASMIKNSDRICLYLANESTVLEVISSFDKWSITVRYEDGSHETFFKHAIVSFKNGMNP